MTEAWRSTLSGVGSVQYGFGDGTTNRFTTDGATNIAALKELAGEEYDIYTKTIRYTYPGNGVFTVSGGAAAASAARATASTASRWTSSNRPAFNRSGFTIQLPPQESTQGSAR